MMTPTEVAKNVVKALDDKKARDITVLKTEKLTSLAEYFIICTATSTTHIKTLSDETYKALCELDEPPIHREGYRSGGWVLLDYGCVIAHIFLEETRKFYNLERLWSDAEEVSLSSLIGPC